MTYTGNQPTNLREYLMTVRADKDGTSLDWMDVCLCVSVVMTTS